MNDKVPTGAWACADTLQPYFAARPEVVLAYLFGSTARGQAGAWP